MPWGRQGDQAWAVPAPPGSMWRQHQGTAAVITRAVYETRAVSQAAMGPAEGTYYYAGGFYGGRVTEVSVCIFAGVSCHGEVGVGRAGGRGGSGVRVEEAEKKTERAGAGISFGISSGKMQGLGRRLEEAASVAPCFASLPVQLYPHCPVAPSEDSALPAAPA